MRTVKNQTSHGLSPPQGSIVRLGSSGKTIAVITARISADRSSIQVSRFSSPCRTSRLARTAASGGSAGRRGVQVSRDRQSAKQEDAKARKDACDAEILVMRCLARLEPGEDGGKAEKAGDEHGRRVERVRQCGRNAAEQAGYAVSADPGCAATLGRVALPPAALKPHEQADRQCQSEPCNESVHRTACSQAATEGSRSRTQATICLAFIAPEVRAISLPP